eukprot:CAMPEP_0174237256 /NCGR_PEP_ID=MMETSP0417-20130205/7513_1 /TAXON_ID=242541 /ORGANISM="Mayorella sp, Strain BSH-02190019" /LENGTH=703 /DNA_ID=CAMNT_0015315993 /DNA_START=149 /DNA_END=2257 /DNA_ORIENTATION=+
MSFLRNALSLAWQTSHPFFSATRCSLSSSVNARSSRGLPVFLGSHPSHRFSVSGVPVSSAWSFTAAAPTHAQLPCTSSGAARSQCAVRSSFPSGESTASFHSSSATSEQHPTSASPFAFTNKGALSGGLQSVLTDEQRELVNTEKALLERFAALLEKLEADTQDVRLLQNSRRDLEELFMLVVVGEFNSGKSSFLNALLGHRYLAEGVTPTTQKINLIKYGEKVAHVDVSSDIHQVKLPVEWLQDINLVDTPGTNAILQSHQQITEDFVPRSDFIVFVTSSDRAFSQSERQFMERIRDWKKKVVVVLSKVDQLEGDQVSEVTSFVRSGISELLHIQPLIFPVSSRLAMRAKQQFATDPQAPPTETWKQSGFDELESYLLQTLSGNKRAALKLESPLGVLQALVEKYTVATDTRAQLLRRDVNTMENVDDQLIRYREEMTRDYQFQMARIEKVLLDFQDRGDKFLDETIRLSNFVDLMRSDRIRAEFQNRVVADTTRDIDRQVSALIDWMIERNSRQWRNINDYMNNRATVRSKELMGRGNRQFEYNREELLKSIGKGVSEVIHTYDRDDEARRLSSQMKQSLYMTGLVEMGALGIGTLLTTSLLDVTGLSAAGVLAVSGLAILPYKRNAMKREFHKNIESLRERLSSALLLHFEQSLDHELMKLRDSISPYSSYVLRESEKLSALRGEFEELEKDIHIVKTSI